MILSIMKHCEDSLVVFETRRYPSRAHTNVMMWGYDLGFGSSPNLQTKKAYGGFCFGFIEPSIDG